MQPIQERRQRRHLLFVKILELEHDGPELAVHGLQYLKESVQQIDAEEVRVRLIDTSLRSLGLPGIGVRQGDGIGSLDSEPEIVGHAAGIASDHLRVWESDAGREQTPEPLVDLDRREVSGIVRQVVIRVVPLVRETGSE